MASLDNLVVTTALPVIRVHLHAGLSGLEWTVNAYTLTFAVLAVECGRHRRAIWPAPDLHPRHRHLHRGVRGRRPGAVHRRPGGRPGRARGRRGHDHAVVADPPERRRAAGTSQRRPRDLGRHRRRGRRHRTTGRRGDHDRVGLAVHLLAQRADRRSSWGSWPGGSSPSPAATSARLDLRGRAAGQRRPVRRGLRPGPGQLPRVDQHRRAQCVRHRRRRTGRLRLVGTADRATRCCRCAFSAIEPSPPST